MAPSLCSFGVPKEVKTEEHRVGMTPTVVHHLTHLGSTVFVERGAGLGSGFPDDEYAKAGAQVVSVEEVYLNAEVIVKIKEPQPSEFARIRPGQLIFTFFHFAGVDGLSKAMRERGCVCCAYEIVAKDDGSLPILAPMSEVAGRLAVTEGTHLLAKHGGQGRGVLITGVTGVPGATVCVIGAGVAGSSAARLAAAMGARVILLDNNMSKLRALTPTLPANISTMLATREHIAKALEESDLAIGAALVPGAHAPALVDEEMLCGMRPGSVFVDISIDQGGITSVSRATTHKAPTFVHEKSEVIMYCVANMPGAVPRTSTEAIVSTTIPYLEEMAIKGWKRAVEENRELKRGIVTL